MTNIKMQMIINNNFKFTFDDIIKNRLQQEYYVNYNIKKEKEIDLNSNQIQISSKFNAVPTIVQSKDFSTKLLNYKEQYISYCINNYQDLYEF